MPGRVTHTHTSLSSRMAKCWTMRVLGATALDRRSTCASYGLERPCSSFGPCPEEPVPKGNNPEVEYEGEEKTMSEDLFPGEPGLGSGLADNQDEPYEPESPIAEPERSAQRKPEQVRFQVDENERGAGQAKEVPVPVPPSAEENPGTSCIMQTSNRGAKYAWCGKDVTSIITYLDSRAMWARFL